MTMMSASNSSFFGRFGANLNTLTVAGGLAGAAFVGYCIYFDSRRRSDPQYKEKVLEKRRLKKQSQSSEGSSKVSFPNLNNPSEMQNYFLQEVQLDLEAGVEHLSNAVASCGSPQQLMQIFQQTLPPHAFTMLVQSIPKARKRFMGMVEEMTAKNPVKIEEIQPNQLIDTDLE